MSEVGTPGLKRLGDGGPLVPLFGLGSWNTWDRIDFSAAVAIVRYAVEHGANLFDVAHYNMGPHAEAAHTDVLFGRIVEAAGLRREDYVLCGKLWLWDYPGTSFDVQMERSLFRVGVERADTVVVGDFFGEIDLRQVAVDVAEQVRAGRFSSWGVNNWSAADVRLVREFAASEGLAPPSFAQLKYSLARRSVPEGAPYAALFAEGLGLQASDVFEGGILAGKLFPERKIGADPGGLREKIRAAAGKLASVAERFDATPAQVAIAFCLSHPPVSNVLFGASSLTQLQENLGALALFQRHGGEIRDAVNDLWVDRGVVDPSASWGTVEGQKLP